MTCNMDRNSLIRGCLIAGFECIFKEIENKVAMLHSVTRVTTKFFSVLTEFFRGESFLPSDRLPLADNRFSRLTRQRSGHRWSGVGYRWRRGIGRWRSRFGCRRRGRSGGRGRSVSNGGGGSDGLKGEEKESEGGLEKVRLN